MANPSDETASGPTETPESASESGDQSPVSGSESSDQSPDSVVDSLFQVTGGAAVVVTGMLAGLVGWSRLGGSEPG